MRPIIVNLHSDCNIKISLTAPLSLGGRRVFLPPIIVEKAMRFSPEGWTKALPETTRGGQFPVIPINRDDGALRGTSRREYPFLPSS